MKEGESRRLFIHPDLAYGVAGHLPPNSLLIFDIEIVKADTPKSSQESDDETAADDSSDDEDDGEDESDDEGETQEHKK
jgi:peptidylprolyl isomerase